MEHRAQLAGLICEDAALDLPAPAVALAVLKGLSHIAPHARSITLRNEDFSRDRSVVEAMNADPQIAGEAQPIATVAAIGWADDRMRQSFDAVRTPLLVIRGSEDRAAKAAGSELLCEKTASAEDAQDLRRALPRSPE